MTIDFSDTDVIFIYGQFQKQLAEIEKISLSENCPFDKKTIENNRAPYLSVIEKLSSQVPGLTKMDSHF